VKVERTTGVDDLPQAGTCWLIDFDRAEVLVVKTSSQGEQFFLVVLGMKPYLNMEVDLAPQTYVRPPDYWGIEVFGYLPGGGGPTALAPYVASIPLHQMAYVTDIFGRTTEANRQRMRTALSTSLTGANNA